MSQIVFRYTFASDVPAEEIELAILLAALSCEGLHGQIDTLLEAVHSFDRESKICALDGSTPIGRDFNRLFAGFLNREFAADEYLVEMVQGE